LLGAPFLVAFVGLLLASRLKFVRVIVALMVIGTSAQTYGSLEAIGPDSKALAYAVGVLISWLCGLLLTPIAFAEVFSRLNMRLSGPLDASDDAANPTVESDARKSGARGSP
jgi:tellurite resistance protein TehA-like permease